MAARMQSWCTLQRILGKRYLMVRTGRSWTFPRPRNTWRKWHCHSPHQTKAQHVTQVAECGLCRHPLQSQFCRRWAEPHHYTCCRHSLGWPPVTRWSHCTSFGPTAYTASIRWSCCRHQFSRQHRGTGRNSKHIMANIMASSIYLQLI